MTEPEVDFITKMVLDEVMELLATVYTPEVAKAKMCNMIKESKDIAKEDFSAQPTEKLQVRMRERMTKEGRSVVPIIEIYLRIFCL